MNRWSRRHFLGGIGSVALGAAWPARAQDTRARVASVTNGDVWSGSGWTDSDLDPTHTRATVDQVLVSLTKEASAGSAVGALLPGIGDGSQRYAIKVNCVNQALPTHPTVVAALCDLLIEAGARAENIVVFDRIDHELADCGFAIHRGEGVQVYSTTHDDQVGYSDTPAALTHGAVRLSRILESADHVINVPVLKNHEMAGVTLALKNHFGSIDHPELLHAADRSCCPGIAELNAHPAIRDKTRLVLLDALFGTYESGLAALPDFAPMTLVASTDPVAADTVGQETINSRRARAGLDAIDARHIGEAAAAGLGTTDIERITVELSPVVEKPPPGATDEGCGCSNTVPVLTTAAAILLARRRGL